SSSVIPILSCRFCHPERRHNERSELGQVEGPWVSSLIPSGAKRSRGILGFARPEIKRTACVSSFSSCSTRRSASPLPFCWKNWTVSHLRPWPLAPPAKPSQVRSLAPEEAEAAGWPHLQQQR